MPSHFTNSISQYPFKYKLLTSLHSSVVSPHIPHHAVFFHPMDSVLSQWLLFFFFFFTITLTTTTRLARAQLPGTLELVVENAGISSMHTAVTRFNTVVLLDRTNIGPSRKMLPRGHCRFDCNDAVLKRDC